MERFLREQNQRSRDKEANTAKMDKQMEAIERVKKAEILNKERTKRKCNNANGKSLIID